MTLKVTQNHPKWSDSIGHCITSYYWSVVTTTLSGTVSEILLHLQCTWLLVTFRSTSASTRQLKIQVTCAFWITCKQVIINTSYISQGIGITMLKRQNVTKVIQGHWRCCHSISHIRFPISLPLQIYFARFRDIINYEFPKFKDVTWLWTNVLGGNLSQVN